MLANVDLPTSWAGDDEWRQAAVQLRQWLEDVGGRRGQAIVIRAGNWNVCLDSVAEAKGGFLEDLQAACRLEAAQGEWTRGRMYPTILRRYMRIDGFCTAATDRCCCGAQAAQRSISGSVTTRGSVWRRPENGDPHHGRDMVQGDGKLGLQAGKAISTCGVRSAA